MGKKNDTNSGVYQWLGLDAQDHILSLSQAVTSSEYRLSGEAWAHDVMVHKQIAFGPDVDSGEIDGNLGLVTVPLCRFFYH
jgi:hypothetical protein